MSDEPLDETDRKILAVLQKDARNHTNTHIGEQVGIAPSTVGKRLSRLEEDGIIKGYYPAIDYDQANYPLRFLFICSTEIADRSNLIEKALEINGVVNIRELMTGERNVLVEVVGNQNEDITRLATAINGLGIKVDDEILVKSVYSQPASVFSKTDG